MKNKWRIEFYKEHGIDESFLKLSTRSNNFLYRVGLKNKTDAVAFFKINTFEDIKALPYVPRTPGGCWARFGLPSLNFGIKSYQEIQDFLND
jgi:hypothetical protein